MTPERWRQVEEIFQAALDLSPGERTRYVSEVCKEDAELKRDVEVLLSQYDSAGELLEEPIYGNTEMNMLESFVEEQDPMLGRRRELRFEVRKDLDGRPVNVFSEITGRTQFNRLVVAHDEMAPLAPPTVSGQ